MGEHMNEYGQFQSDKYPWCHAGFFPMKFLDEKAQPLIWRYAEIMTECGIDGTCAADIRTALRNAGFKGPQESKAEKVARLTHLVRSLDQRGSYPGKDPAAQLRRHQEAKHALDVALMEWGAGTGQASS